MICSLSGLALLAACPGSASLSRQRRESAAANLGSAIHEWIEMGVRGPDVVPIDIAERWDLDERDAGRLAFVARHLRLPVPASARHELGVARLGRGAFVEMQNQIRDAGGIEVGSRVMWRRRHVEAENGHKAEASVGASDQVGPEHGSVRGLPGAATGDRVDAGRHPAPAILGGALDGVVERGAEVFCGDKRRSHAQAPAAWRSAAVYGVRRTNRGAAAGARRVAREGRRAVTTVAALFVACGGGYFEPGRQALRSESGSRRSR